MVLWTPVAMWSGVWRRPQRNQGPATWRPGYAASMTTDDRSPDPRRVLKDDLWAQGVPDDAAEELIAAWEAHARDAGISPLDAGYWSLAASWIDRERGAS